MPLVTQVPTRILHGTDPTTELKFPDLKATLTPDPATEDPVVMEALEELAELVELAELAEPDTMDLKDLVPLDTRDRITILPGMVRQDQSR